MNMEILNKICYTICIVCIVMGTLLALLMIWADLYRSEFIWRAWLTILIFFLASGMTLSVNKAFAWRNRDGR